MRLIALHESVGELERSPRPPSRGRGEARTDWRRWNMEKRERMGKERKGKGREGKRRWMFLRCRKRIDVTVSYCY